MDVDIHSLATINTMKRAQRVEVADEMVHSLKA
jgi:hypothetical protein